jgi:GTP-binding protein
MKSAHDLGKPLVVAVNKWDLQEPPTGSLGKNSPIKKDFLRILSNEIPEAGYAIVRFVSALEKSGLDGVMKAVKTAVENWGFRAPTGELNRLIQDAVFDKPVSRKGKAAKIYYVTQAEVHPPTIVLFANDPELLHFSYLRYLENQVRKKWSLEGTPVRVVARRSAEKR